MSETTRRRVKTLKTYLAMRQPELFEKRKILKIGQVAAIIVHFELDPFIPSHDIIAYRKSLLRCQKFSCNYFKSVTLELSNETRFFTFRPFYDPVEPLEVDLFPVFSSISQIFRLFFDYLLGY